MAAIGNPATQGARSKAQMQLKQDLLPLLAVLALNTTLTSIDVSGHMMGNKGATALGKALQINKSLLHLAWDENGTTLPGFSYFRFHHPPSLPIFPTNRVQQQDWDCREPYPCAHATATVRCEPSHEGSLGDRRVHQRQEPPADHPRDRAMRLPKRLQPLPDLSDRPGRPERHQATPSQPHSKHRPGPSPRRGPGLRRRRDRPLLQGWRG